MQFPSFPFSRVARLAALAAAVWCGLAAPASAGQGKFKWWQSERFIRELALTAEQSRRIEDVFQASWPALHAAKDDLDRLEGELSRLIAEGTTDEAAVLHKIDKVEASRSAMGRTRSLMLYRMHRILTADQRVRLKALYEAVEREKAEKKHSSADRPK